MIFLKNISQSYDIVQIPFFWGATLVTYGNFQARDQIWAAAASETLQDLQPTSPQWEINSIGFFLSFTEV